jgi:hypothetical protein
MSQEDPKQLLRDGIEAAREGDRKKARELLEKVVELEENNEKGWLWLASVMDNEEERRICFANVLQINPDNERAQKEMAKIEARLNKTKADEEVMPGVSRRQLTRYITIAAVIVVIVFAVIAIIAVVRGASQAAIEGEATAVAQRATDLFSTQAAEAANATATAQAIASPTPTPTETRDIPTLPPTWTPVPIPTNPEDAPALPAPVGIPGFLVGWRGLDFSGRGFYQAVYYPLDGSGAFTQIVDPARAVTLNLADGNRVVYTAPFSAGQTFGLQAMNLNGTQPEEITLRWSGTTEQFIEQDQASFSRDGTKLVFIALSTATETHQVYIIDMLSSDSATALTRFTMDDGDYSYPVFSPDGTRIAVVRNDVNGANPGEDIVILDVATRSPVAQVTNNGAQYIESHIQWVNDTTLGYAFAPQENRNVHDIAIVPADSSNAQAQLPARDLAADDDYPVFSPDGAYMAFVSNRRGQYDIYIVNLSDETQFFQLTNTEEPDFLGAWYVPS